jgi:hypothetical protein
MNPNTDTISTANSRREIQYIRNANVVSLSTQTEQTDISVKPTNLDGSINVSLGGWSNGDAWMPETGDTLVIGYRLASPPIVLGYRYPESVSRPDVQAGERVIGHGGTTSTISFNNDGSVTVEADSGATVTLEADGTVTINGGSKNPITEITTSKSDGKVTSVDTTKSTDVFVP